jgi:hypothetical protein
VGSKAILPVVHDAGAEQAEKASLHILQRQQNERHHVARAQRAVDAREKKAVLKSERDLLGAQHGIGRKNEHAPQDAQDRLTSPGSRTPPGRLEDQLVGGQRTDEVRVDEALRQLLEAIGEVCAAEGAEQDLACMIFIAFLIWLRSRRFSSARMAPGAVAQAASAF